MRRAAPAATPSAADGDRVGSVRHFNRFYTQRIGVVNGAILGSSFSLTEARVLYEFAHRERPTAAELAAELGLDPGYLSRVLRGFELAGILRRTPSEMDARKSHLELTPEGRGALDQLDRAAREQVAEMLRPVPVADQARLVASMRTIESVLSGGPPRSEACVIRAHEPGDLGWIVERHGEVYAAERGWDARFEGLVAGIVAEFADDHDAKRERLWIAEIRGERAGSVMLVAKSRTVAQLRLLFVEPWARGRGIGASLVAECVRAARAAGYRTIVLWTEGGLDAARRLYERAGFTLRSQRRERRYGAAFVAQEWALALRPAPARRKRPRRPKRPARTAGPGA